ncbi:MAG: Rab family GTPase [Candidatus Hodarchaeales archaeon]|jgi:Ras-related protein Rab-11A
MTDIRVKVVICGDYAVGKTTFVRSFIEGDLGIFEGYKPTIGVDIGRKSFTIDSHQFVFQIWDLSGQQTFKAIRSQFYNRSDGCILVFDVTRKHSFDNLTFWLDEMMKRTGSIPTVLVGNKIDLRDESIAGISPSQAIEFASYISTRTGEETPYVEASAIQKQNNLDPFIMLGKILLPKFI